MGGTTIVLLCFLFLSCVLLPEETQAAPASCSSRADIWFANDESGSVSAAEFEDSFNFMCQVSDRFNFDDSTGIKTCVIGWPNDVVPSLGADIVIPITQDFGDPGDPGLIVAITT